MLAPGPPNFWDCYLASDLVLGTYSVYRIDFATDTTITFSIVSKVLATIRTVEQRTELA